MPAQAKHFPWLLFLFPQAEGNYPKQFIYKNITPQAETGEENYADPI